MIANQITGKTSLGLSLVLLAVRACCDVSVAIQIVVIRSRLQSAIFSCEMVLDANLLLLGEIASDLLMRFLVGLDPTVQWPEQGGVLAGASGLRRTNISAAGRNTNDVLVRRENLGL